MIDQRQVPPATVTLSKVTRVLGRGRDRVRALDAITTRFEAGTFTAVMGPSGSGKTTLLQCAAGLDRPTSGSVWLGDQEVSRMRDGRLAALRRHRIGFVFQSFNLLPSLTAAENVILPRRLAGERIRTAAGVEALAVVGCADVARRRPAELSGGQQQRVAIARAILSEPDVVFADEPTGALDDDAARGILALLRQLAYRDGRTIVMVTHDPLAAAVADRVVLLAAGALIEDLDSPGTEPIAPHGAALAERP